MMIFEDEMEGGGVKPVLKPAPQQGDAFGVLSGLVVILHSLSSSEYVHVCGHNNT